MVILNLKVVLVHQSQKKWCRNLSLSALNWHFAAPCFSEKFLNPHRGVFSFVHFSILAIMSLIGFSGGNPDVSLLFCTIPWQIQLYWKKKVRGNLPFHKKREKQKKPQYSIHVCTNIQSEVILGISSSHAHTSYKKINDQQAEQVGCLLFFFFLSKEHDYILIWKNRYTSTSLSGL